MKLTASVLLLLFNLLEIRDGYSLSTISDTTIQNRSNEHTFLPIKDLDHDLDTRSFEAVLESHFNELQIFKQRNDYSNVAKTYYNIAVLNFTIGEYCLGQSYLQEALKIYKINSLTHDSMKEIILLSTMESYCKLNQYSELNDLLIQFNETEKHLVNGANKTLIDYFYAYYFLAIDSFDLAELKFTDAADQFKHHDEPLKTSASIFGLAELYFKRENYSKAIQFAVESLKGKEQILNDEFKCAAYKLLYKAHYNLNNLNESINYMNKFRTIFRTMTDKRSAFIQLERYFAKIEQAEYEAYNASVSQHKKAVLDTKYKIAIFIILSSILGYICFAVYTIYSRKKRYALELNKVQTTLETANQALQRSIINLEKSNADLKYFSKIIAHDLNHPLVTILGYSNIILKANKKKMNEEEIKKLQTIIKDSTEMSDTINSLLQNSFPRLEKDQVNFGK
jgi:hypothetical protein